MRPTSGTWLHAQLTLLVAACFSASCGESTTKVGVGTAGAGTAAGGSDNAPQAGNSGDAGRAAAGGTVAQGGNVAQGGERAEGGSVSQGGEVAVGGATHGGAPGLICAGNSPKLTDGWHTEPALDYVAQLWGRPGAPAPATQDESGMRCAGASSKADCDAAYDALVPATSWYRGAPLSFPEYFAYTRGDDVGTIGSLEELRQILGDIDTANEAAVWLYVNDRSVSCDQLETLADGYLGHASALLSDCPITYQPMDVKVARDGTLTETKRGAVQTSNSCAGRRPHGLEIAAGARAPSNLGDCFARMAELELASIAAFTVLERQLAAHGAPEPLLQRCCAARRDEIAHARVVTQLARRFGAQPKPVRVAPQGLPSLWQLALDNAREGCVRELYGAAVATWQAAHALDPQIRKVFSGIARDEAEHAALALDLARWLEPHLSDAERAEVEAERQHARVQLQAELLVAPDAEAQSVAGLPSAAQAAALLTALFGGSPTQVAAARRTL
jgi:hypothetical protein